MSNSKLHGMLPAMDAYERRQRQELLAFLSAQSQVPAHLLEPTAYGDGVNAAVARRNAPQPPQDSAACALTDCDEPAAYTCVCCNRRVCFYDISGAVLDIEPGLCHECLTECAGGMACKVVTRV